MKKMTFSVTFRVRISKQNRDQIAPIECVLRSDNKTVAFSINRKVNPELFDNAKQKMKGRTDQAVEVNEYISECRKRIFEIEKELISNGFIVTPELVKDALNNNVERLKDYKLLEVFKQHNDQAKQLEGKKGYSKATLWINEYTYSLVSSFMLEKLRRKDIYLTELNQNFLREFHLHLLKRMSQNSSTKHLKLIKKIINISIANQYIKYDPFGNYKVERVAVNIEYLTKEELTKFETQLLNIPRWERARDMFVFICYTGLAFVDVKNLQESDIVKEDEMYWIKKERVKTGISFSVPLLPKAKAIVDKYKSMGEFIPKLDCSDVNKYIKDIACICKINKRITFHTARHTFATTVTLSNRISLEVVAKMLGHTNTRMTSHYAKVVDEYIKDEMKKLM